ncbi:MAG: glycosyltransferase [Candidatus Cloacimonetes bacterium]|nr:glycosyltransferase [Candidatus Cloacimonadota bacterium]
MIKADLHCHSAYSEHPSEWFLQRLGAAESYTDPIFIYKELKKQKMNFVTITDHNRIDGALILKARYPEHVIVGLEATTYFPEDNCKIHILIYGLNEMQFDIIQTIRTNIYDLRDYLLQERLTHSIAHATYSVNGKLTLEHLEKLILMFDVFEVRNGGRNELHNDIFYRVLSSLNPDHLRELEQKYRIKPASSDPWVKGYTGGSDDHAGIFLGKTYTTAQAATSEEFLDAIRNRKTAAGGRHNDFQGLAFTLYKIALDFAKTKSKSFNTTFFGKISDFLYNEESLSLITRMKLKNLNRISNGMDDELKKNYNELIQTLQKQKNNISLEERFQIAYAKISDIVDSFFKVLLESFAENLSQGNLLKLIRNFSSSLPGVFLTLPFYSTISHLHANRNLLMDLQKRFDCFQEKKEKNILWFSDTLEDLNGVSATLTKVHELSRKANYRLKIVGIHSQKSDDENFINLPLMHGFELPYYEHQKIRIPSPLTAMEKIYRANPDKILISTPGPIGLLALLTAKLFNLPCTGIYHTDFRLQTNGIKDDESLVSLVDGYTQWFYQQMDELYVPSRSYMDILEERGIDRSKMKIFPRGIEYDVFFPRRNGRAFLQNEFEIREGKYLLYTGRISKDKNLDVIMEAFLKLQREFPDLYLLLVGEGPHRSEFQKRFQHDNIIFTGKVDRNSLPDFYSGADLFLFPSTADTYGMSVLEAQACCLPAFVSSAGGPKEIIENNLTGRVISDMDPEVWRSSIREYLLTMDESPEKILKMRQASRENVMGKSSWNNFFHEFVN